VLDFDNSTFTSNLAEQKLALLDSMISFRTAESLAALDLDAKEFALKTAQIALAKAKLLATVPEDLLPARTFQERQLDQKRTSARRARRGRARVCKGDGRTRSSGEADRARQGQDRDRERREVDRRAGRSLRRAMASS